MTTSFEDVNKFLKRLSKMTTEELRKEVYQNSDQYAEFYSLMGAVIDKSCGNSNKLQEFIAAIGIIKLYYSTNCYKIQHRKVSNGADIILKDIEYGVKYGIEVKSSCTKKAGRYKTNWMFGLNENLWNQYMAADKNKKKR
jgi:hypothetical protein